MTSYDKYPKECKRSPCLQSICRISRRSHDQEIGVFWFHLSIFALLLTAWGSLLTQLSRPRFESCETLTQLAQSFSPHKLWQNHPRPKLLTILPYLPQESASSISNELALLFWYLFNRWPSGFHTFFDNLNSINIKASYLPLDSCKRRFWMFSALVLQARQFSLLLVSSGHWVRTVAASRRTPVAWCFIAGAVVSFWRRPAN